MKLIVYGFVFGAAMGGLIFEGAAEIVCGVVALASGVAFGLAASSMVERGRARKAWRVYVRRYERWLAMPNEAECRRR